MAVGWLLAFSTVGGVTNLLAMYAGLHLFRATNRAVVFVSAIALLWLAAGLSRRLGRCPALVRLTAAVLLLATGLLDQVPRLRAGQLETVQRAVASDVDFGRRLEAALPAHAMVFQLPRLDFPEVEPPYRLHDYEHFRPYLATTNLRFSYGVPRFRARGRWQRDLQDQPPAKMIRTLERCGFGALYLNRKGYADGGADILAQLARLGYRRRIESVDGDQVAVLLRPTAHPRLPIAHQLTIGEGWKLRPNDGGPWAYEAGALSLFNPYPHPILVHLRLSVVSGVRRDLELALNERVLTSLDVTADGAPVDLPCVTVASGINTFWLRSRETAAEHEPGSRTNEERAFGLQDNDVTLVAMH
jgi:hypothetical protein